MKIPLLRTFRAYSIILLSALVCDLMLNSFKHGQDFMRTNLVTKAHEGRTIKRGFRSVNQEHVDDENGRRSTDKKQSQILP